MERERRTDESESGGKWEESYVGRGGRRGEKGTEERREEEMETEEVKRGDPSGGRNEESRARTQGRRAQGTSRRDGRKPIRSSLGVSFGVGGSFV